MSWSEELYNEYERLISLGKQQGAVYTVFSTLHDNLKEPHKLDEFLKLLMTKELSSDLMVHVMNVCVPVTEKLSNWQDFKTYCRNSLLLIVGEKTTVTLMGVCLGK